MSFSGDAGYGRQRFTALPLGEVGAAAPHFASTRGQRDALYSGDKSQSAWDRAALAYRRFSRWGARNAASTVLLGICLAVLLFGSWRIVLSSNRPAHRSIGSHTDSASSDELLGGGRGPGAVLAGIHRLKQLHARLQGAAARSVVDHQSPAASIPEGAAGETYSALESSSTELEGDAAAAAAAASAAAAHPPVRPEPEKDFAAEAPVKTAASVSSDEEPAAPDQLAASDAAAGLPGHGADAAAGLPGHGADAAAGLPGHGADAAAVERQLMDGADAAPHAQHAGHLPARHVRSEQAALEAGLGDAREPPMPAIISTGQSEQILAGQHAPAPPSDDAATAAAAEHAPLDTALLSQAAHDALPQQPPHSFDGAAAAQNTDFEGAALRHEDPEAAMFPPAPVPLATVWSWQSWSAYTSAPDLGWPGTGSHGPQHLPLPASWIVRPRGATAVRVPIPSTAAAKTATASAASGDVAEERAGAGGLLRGLHDEVQNAAAAAEAALEAAARAEQQARSFSGDGTGAGTDGDKDDTAARISSYAAVDFAHATLAQLREGSVAADVQPSTQGVASAHEHGDTASIAAVQRPSVRGRPLPRLAADVEKREAVKEAFLHSWRPYKEHAWGQDTLKPVSKRGDNGFLGLGITITDSLDTLAIMGLHEELQEAIAWVESPALSFAHQENINLFETFIRVLGGLLSAWELTHRAHPGLLAKAKACADAMMFAFESSTGLPYGTVSLASHSKYNPAWVQGASTIAEVATLQLELEYLSHATGDAHYALAGRRVMGHLSIVEPHDGLWPMFIHPDSGAFTSSTITLGARGDSLYEYLIKQPLLAGLGLHTTSSGSSGGEAANGAADGATAGAADAAFPLSGITGNAAMLSKRVPLANMQPLESSHAARAAWQSARTIACQELAALAHTRHQLASAAAASESTDDIAGGAGEAADSALAAPHLGLDTKAHGGSVRRMWYACTDAAVSPCYEPAGLAGAARAVSAALAHSPVLPAAFPWYLGVDAQVCGFAEQPEMQLAASWGAEFVASTSSHGTSKPIGADATAAEAGAADAETAGAADAANVRSGPASDRLSEASYFASLHGMWLRSAAGIESHLLRRSSPSGFAYIAERHGDGRFEDKQDHLVCFLAGALALSARVAPTEALSARHLRLAEELADTCVHTYRMTATGLAPEITRFPGGGDPVVDAGSKHNLLRPETMESLFVLYRVTGDEKWRAAGWDIFTAFNTHSRVPEGGYSTLADVTVVPPFKNDHQESFWLAETLKYAYLLFADSDVIPLDRFVFNTEAHPLPVFGTV